MTELPLHTAHLVQKLLDRYCARICPPWARQAVPLGFRVQGLRVTLHELRLFCGVPGTHRHVPVAQFRYRLTTGDWALHYAGHHGGWKPYTPLASSRSFVELLRELDADAHGLFWGRLNGKSLRWCSARGRCAGCDVKYCEILGLSEVVDLRSRAP